MCKHTVVRLIVVATCVFFFLLSKDNRALVFLRMPQDQRPKPLMGAEK